MGRAAQISNPEDLERALGAEKAAIAELGAWWRVPTDPDWPLAGLQDGVMRGVGELPTSPRVAIVGARKADGDAIAFTQHLVSRAAAFGLSVVSGGALGVDITAHRAALSSGLPTVVVLGSGLNKMAPVRHRADFERIKGNGAVISPFPCSQSAARWTFPVRNPWIAALSDVIIIVQAGRASGALQTGRAALALEKPVWVVPGPLGHPLHEGCHLLANEGAQIMLDDTGWSEGVRRSEELPRREPRVPAAHGDLWRAFAGGKTLDEVSVSMGQSVDTLFGPITELELSGWLRRRDDGGFMPRTPGESRLSWSDDSDE